MADLCLSADNVATLFTLFHLVEKYHHNSCKQLDTNNIQPLRSSNLNTVELRFLSAAHEHLNSLLQPFNIAIVQNDASSTTNVCSYSIVKKQMMNNTVSLLKWDELRDIKSQLSQYFLKKSQHQEDQSFIFNFEAQAKLMVSLYRDFEAACDSGGTHTTAAGTSRANCG